MSRRTLVDIDDRILDAVMEIGAAEGVSAISAQKVAKICGISHFTCFDHFGTRQNMIDQAKIAFENKYTKILMDNLNQYENIEDLWVAMLDELTKTPSGTVFYLNYNSLYGFKPTPQNMNFGMFKGTLIKVLGEIPGFTDEMYMLTWDYLFNQAFIYARYIIRGNVSNTPNHKNFIKDLVFRGVREITSGKCTYNL